MDPFKVFVLLTMALTMYVMSGATADTKAECLGEISQSTGTCYTYHNSVVTWPEARQFCRAQGGHLAAITDFADQDVLRYLLPRDQTPAGTTAAWIGAYHTKGEWTWIETGQVLSPQGCYTDRREDGQRDMEILINVTNLTPDRCIDACRRISSPKTYQYAAVQGGTQCYCGNNTYGRYGTNKDCTISCSPTSSYYCGGSLMNFVYKIGGAYGLWAFAQPNNYKGNQNCGIIDTSQAVKMADESCFQPQAYMCEIVSASKASCLNSSSEYYYYEDISGRCFYINETKVTWYDARERCHLLSNPGPGRLVTIDSAKTHEIIRTVTTRSVPVARKIWIGLYKGRGWQWTTGAAFNFSFWVPREVVPGNPISVNTCGAVNVTYSNSWTDASCDTKLPYICQSVKMGKTTKLSTSISTASTPRRTSTSTTTTTTTTMPTTTTTTTTTTMPTTTTTTMPTTTTTTTMRTTTTSATTTTATTRSSSSSTTTTTATTTTTTSRAGDVPVPINSTVVTTSEMPRTVAPPSSGQSTSDNDQLSTVELVLAIVMSLLGLILLILCIYCLLLLAKKRNKVHYLYDARPIAREPNGGNTIIEEYDNYVAKDAMTSSTTELYRAALW